MFKVSQWLFLLLFMAGFAYAQPPVIYSESNITQVSPGVYQTWNCASTFTDLWTDSTYASYSWSSGQTTNRITLSGLGGYNSPYYSLTLTVTDGQGNTSSSAVVADSLQNPILVQMAPYGTTQVCAGGVVSLGIQFTGNFEQLVWTNGHVVNTPSDCDWTSQGTCFEDFTTSGYQGVDRIFTGTGCHYPQTMPIGVWPYPATPTITQSNDTLFADVVAPKYIWYDASQTTIPNATAAFYKPTVAGNYFVKADGSPLVMLACPSALSSAYNYTAPLCTAGYTWMPDTSGQFSILVTNTCTPTPGNGGTYLWDFGDGNTSTQAYPQHQYAGPGNYNVCVTVSFSGCSQTYCDTIVVINKVSAPFTINVVDPNAIAVDPNMSDLQATVWPNPSQGQIQVDFQLTAAEQVRLRLLDLRGSVVVDGASRTIEAGTQRLSLDASAVAQGIYIAELWVGERAQHFKVVLQK
jgi:PKD domain/Secretion system C-terminal sorting domain